MLLKRLGISVLVAGALGVLAWYYAPARLTVLVLLGRSPECPWREAIRAARNERDQTAVKDRILSASRLIQKDERGFELWDTPKGQFWIPKGNQWVLPFNLAEQERGIYFTATNTVGPGDIVLDCGANVGVFTRECLRRGARLVVAIEPAPENVECLRRNFAVEEAAGRVRVYPKGVWDREDFLEMNVDPENSAADSFLIERPGSQKIAKVPLTTIDLLVAELMLERVDFIKMDIEGAELKALEGARQTIARFRPKLSISAYHAPDHPRRIPELVRAAYPGYHTECGFCAEVEHRVRPDILYFYLK